MKKYDLKFQKEFAAVFLPRSSSLCFIDTNYANLSQHYVVWLEQKTAQELCKKDLNSLNGHYRFDHDDSLRRIYTPPSHRLPLPYVVYWQGELSFINGRHRTRTLLDFGAQYVPFDIEERSLVRMAQDGIKLDFFETTKAFVERLSPMARYANPLFDPILNTYQDVYPKQMSMEAVIKASRLHLKLLNFDVRASEQLRTVLVALHRDKALKRLDDGSYFYEQILWHRDVLRVALPAFVCLQREGVTAWPDKIGFPTYFCAEHRAMPPENAVRDWAKRLPVTVRLGRPLGGDRSI